MNTELLDLLRCPQSKQTLKLHEPVYENKTIKSGWLLSEDDNYRYPIINFIPRFVPYSNYADNFGMQWNKFRQTQLDSFSQLPISKERFYAATAWSKEQLKDQWVLDVGCGAGRFAEIALDAGAKVVALDYSGAVDACYENLKHHPQLHVIQGDIYSLPLLKNYFSFVYSLGVLQHTPDVKTAFFTLPSMLANGGHLCVDFYEKSWKSMLLPKYWLRPLTKRIPKSSLFSILEFLTPKLLPLSVAIGRIPKIGFILKRIVPVANYVDQLPLEQKAQLEWSLLDTFDWLSPQYDNPQAEKTIKLWLQEAALLNIEVLKAGHLVGRGICQY